LRGLPSLALCAVVSCGGDKPALGPDGAPPADGPADTLGADATADAQAPRRLLAIAPSPREQPPPVTSQDLIDAINLAYDAGCRGMGLSYNWSRLEPSAGNYQLTDLANGVGYLGDQRGFDMLLTIQVLNTTAKETPADLQSVPFDSPQMRARFHALLSAIGAYLGNAHILYLSIGNEVDVYLSAHPGEGGPYKSFYDDGVAFVHQMFPRVKVGVTSTFDGAGGGAAAAVALLNQSSDVYVLTYYPLGAQFMPRPPQTATTDIAQMVQLAAGRPLILQEVGYPASPILGSSEQAQADFVTAVYAAWQSAGPTAIPFLDFFLMHDLTAAQCDTLAMYYGLPNNANFKAYLCSLGLRNVDGTPKLGWQAFTAGAAAAGFP